jgi:hypothetical protein
MITTCFSLAEACRTARPKEFVEQVNFAATTKRVDLVPHYSLEEQL